jgi:hypothetical protein
MHGEKKLCKFSYRRSETHRHTHIEDKSSAEMKVEEGDEIKKKHTNTQFADKIRLNLFLINICISALQCQRPGPCLGIDTFPFCTNWPARWGGTIKSVS